MSVKSIQVKLFIPKTDEVASIRQAVAATHSVHNAGVRYFMENLLKLRQEDVYEDRGSDKPTRKKDYWQEELLRQAQEARKRNRDKCPARNSYRLLSDRFSAPDLRIPCLTAGVL